MGIHHLARYPVLTVSFERYSGVGGIYLTVSSVCGTLLAVSSDAGTFRAVSSVAGTFLVVSRVDGNSLPVDGRVNVDGIAFFMMTQYDRCWLTADGISFFGGSVLGGRRKHEICRKIPRIPGPSTRAVKR